MYGRRHVADKHGLHESGTLERVGDDVERVEWRCGGSRLTEVSSVTTFCPHATHRRV
jgi:hypothetical protein